MNTDRYKIGPIRATSGRSPGSTDRKKITAPNAITTIAIVGLLNFGFIICKFVPSI